MHPGSFTLPWHTLNGCTFLGFYDKQTYPIAVGVGMEGSEGWEDSINFKITTGSLKNATDVPS